MPREAARSPDVSASVSEIMKHAMKYACRLATYREIMIHISHNYILVLTLCFPRPLQIYTDVLRSQDDPNKFFFYEVYVSMRCRGSLYDFNRIFIFISTSSPRPLLHAHQTQQDDADAVAHHKAQPHFDLWTKFKESEGINQSVSKKAYGEFMT